MSRTEMLIAAGATVGLLLAACAEDAPTANPGTPPQGAVLSPTARPTIVVSTVILACVNNSSGEIKIVSAGDACTHNEQLITWSTGSGGGGGSGITGYEIVAHQEFLSPGYWNVHVECTTGKKVLGGGFSIETPNDVKLFTSEPSDGNGNLINHGWNVFVQNAGSLTRQTSVYAICADAQ